MYDYFDCMYLDIDGNPVKRNREQYPYSYDAYVVWKNNYNKGKGYGVVYSDRLFQWNSERYNKCCKSIWGNEGQHFHNRNPEDIESFLSLYYDSKVKLVVVMEGCNVSNGYPYWIFFYEITTK